MSIFDTIKQAKALLDEVEKLQSGPVTVEISAPIHITIKASDGSVVLDTTVQVNEQYPPATVAAPPSS